MSDDAARLPVRKTYKLYVGGAFPRSESGRSYPVTGSDGRVLAWAAPPSRTSVRDAVRAARGAQPGWAGRTAFNRGQVLYRVAEVLEGRRAQLAEELVAAGAEVEAAAEEVMASVDRWVWYAGWTDKIHMVAGSLNPVAGPYWNVSAPEPAGVVASVAPPTPALLGLVDRLAPALCGGNTVVALASEPHPLAAITLAEVLATSDVPPGVANIVTGRTAELAPWLAGHAEVDVVDLTGVTGGPDSLAADAERAAAESVTRVVRAGPPETPHEVLAFMDLKTVWHPAGR